METFPSAEPESSQKKPPCSCPPLPNSCLLCWLDSSSAEREATWFIPPNLFLLSVLARPQLGLGKPPRHGAPPTQADSTLGVPALGQGAAYPLFIGTTGGWGHVPGNKSGMAPAQLGLAELSNGQEDGRRTPPPQPSGLTNAGFCLSWPTEA